MFDAYRHIQKVAETPRAEEYRRLGELTAALMAADEAKSPHQRARAIQENQRFWQELKLSLMTAQQSLPAEMRGQFASLADWVERESVMASLGRSNLADLIAVNKQIMEGLKPFTGTLATDELRVAN